MVKTTQKMFETDLSKEVAKAKARNKAYAEKMAKAKALVKKPVKSKGRGKDVHIKKRLQKYEK